MSTRGEPSAIDDFDETDNSRIYELNAGAMGRQDWSLAAFFIRMPSRPEAVCGDVWNHFAVHPTVAGDHKKLARHALSHLGTGFLIGLSNYEDDLKEAAAAILRMTDWDFRSGDHFVMGPDRQKIVKVLGAHMIMNSTGARHGG